MTIITHFPKAESLRHRSLRGFTLVEVLVSASLSAFLLTGVLASFLFMGRSGISLQNYSDMEEQARVALEIFGQDVRMAKGITWTSSTSLTLTVPDSGGEKKYTYIYNRSTGGFTRQQTAPSTGAVVTLISGVQQFAFTGYSIDTDSVNLSNLTTANATTKQVQIQLTAVRTSSTVADATNSVISARFVLRNKKVTS